jgi:hypothetical protein
MSRASASPARVIVPGAEALDRTTINAWEDEQFRSAVKAIGRKKLIMTALCELQRDWARGETAASFAEILFAVEGY